MSGNSHKTYLIENHSSLSVCVLMYCQEEYEREGVGALSGLLRGQQTTPGAASDSELMEHILHNMHWLTLYTSCVCCSQFGIGI